MQRSANVIPLSDLMYRWHSRSIILFYVARWHTIRGPFYCGRIPRQGPWFMGCDCRPHPICMNGSSALVAAPKSRPTLFVLLRSKSYCVQWGLKWPGLQPKACFLTVLSFLGMDQDPPVPRIRVRKYHGRYPTQPASETAAGDMAKGQILLKPHCAHSKQLFGSWPVRVRLSQASYLCTQTHTHTLLPGLHGWERSQTRQCNQSWALSVTQVGMRFGAHYVDACSWNARQNFLTVNAATGTVCVWAVKWGGFPSTLQGLLVENGTLWRYYQAQHCRISLGWLIKNVRVTCVGQFKLENCSKGWRVNPLLLCSGCDSKCLLSHIQEGNSTGVPTTECQPTVLFGFLLLGHNQPATAINYQTLKSAACGHTANYESILKCSEME